MKPPRFDYHRPANLGETLDLLSQLGEDASILAGGQSLVPMMNIRLAEPAALIDVNRVDELSGITEDDGSIVIGALTRHRTVETSRLVAERQPLLPEAVRHIGHVTIRNRGTIGGSVAHADPSAELAVLARALDAQIVLRSAAGERRLFAGEFFVGPFTTGRREDELVTEVRFPARGPWAGGAFLEVARAHGAFAVVAACAVIELAEGSVSGARVALGGVGGSPVRVDTAEAALIGREPGEAAFQEAAATVPGSIDPYDDVHASAGYRRRVAEVLVRRALELSSARAGGGPER